MNWNSSPQRRKACKGIILERKEWKFLKNFVILLEKTISCDVFSYFSRVFSLRPLRLCGVQNVINNLCHLRNLWFQMFCRTEALSCHYNDLMTSYKTILPK